LNKNKFLVKKKKKKKRVTLFDINTTALPLP